MEPCITNWCWYIVIHLHNIIWQATKDIYTDNHRPHWQIRNNLISNLIRLLEFTAKYWISALLQRGGEHFNSIIRMDFCQWLWLIKLNINQISPNQMFYFQLDKGIAALAPMFLDTVICEGLDYAMMSALPAVHHHLHHPGPVTQRPQLLSLVISQSLPRSDSPPPSLLKTVPGASKINSGWPSNNSWKTAFSFQLF